MYKNDEGKRYRRIKRELSHKGALVDFYKDTMQVPNGHTAEWDLVSHKGAAAVIPVTGNGNIIMVRQYRNPLEDFDLEIPAGSLDSPSEDPKLCAARELEEETGCKSSHLEHLIDIYTTVAFCDEKISIYVADHLEKSAQNLDEDEYLEVEVYPYEKLVEMILDGRIKDGKTVSALLAYGRKYGR